MKIPATFFGCFVAVSILCPFPGLARGDSVPSNRYMEAFNAMPKLVAQDRQYLMEKEWRGHAIDERATQLLGQYDRGFKLLCEASKSEQPVDWKLDISAGPALSMAHLAKAREIAKVGILHSRWNLQNQRAAAAAEELTALVELGVAVDAPATMMGNSVRLSIHDMVCGVIAERWWEMQSPSLKGLVTRLEKKSPEGIMAAAIPFEKKITYDWLLNRIKMAQSQFPADDKKALEFLSGSLHILLIDPTKPGGTLENQVMVASGNTVAGITRYVREMEPMYGEMENVLRTPGSAGKTSAQIFDRKLDSHSNLLIRILIPRIAEKREREVQSISYVALVRAAIEKDQSSVTGAATSAPSERDIPASASRFLLDGVDRGFKLTCKSSPRTLETSIIFIEKPGPGIIVMGQKIGQKIP